MLIKQMLGASFMTVPHDRYTILAYFLYSSRSYNPFNPNISLHPPRHILFAFYIGYHKISYPSTRKRRAEEPSPYALSEELFMRDFHICLIHHCVHERGVDFLMTEKRLT